MYSADEMIVMLGWYDLLRLLLGNSDAKRPLSRDTDHLSYLYVLLNLGCSLEPIKWSLIFHEALEHEIMQGPSITQRVDMLVPKNVVRRRKHGWEGGR